MKSVKRPNKTKAVRLDPKVWLAAKQEAERTQSPIGFVVGKAVDFYLLSLKSHTEAA